MIGSWKLTQNDVDVIKLLLKNGNHTHQQISDLFGVSREHITKINMGQRWNDDTRSFKMKEKKSNDYRQFSGREKVQQQLDDMVFEVEESKTVESILVKYSDGTKDLFKPVNG